jgi:hypothetical protein
LLDLPANTSEFEKLSDYPLTSACAGVSDAAQMGGSEGVMPARANSLESAFIAGTLAAAALLGLNTTASSATECLENPHLRTAEPGHWYYRSDRTRHRRCWFFAPAEVTTDRPVSASPAATADDNSRQSWLSFFIPSFLQPPSPTPQQVEVPQQVEAPQTQPNAIPDRSGEAIQTISPKHARRIKEVRRERPQIAPPPKTTGAADRRDQPKQIAGDEKQSLPLNVADREALFQEFLKWQLDRNLYGRR